MKVAVGVDIGGTKVAVALINEKGEIVSRSQRLAKLRVQKVCIREWSNSFKRYSKKMIYVFKIHTVLVLVCQGKWM